MRFMPAQLSQMRLGCDTRLAAPIVLHLAAAAPADAYGRMVGAPRVEGHNDLYGDCVPTAACNAVQTMLARGGNYAPIGDDVPLGIYEHFGFELRNPATDVGMNPEDLFGWWQGNDVAGARLKSATRLQPADEFSIRHTVATLGGVFLVVELSRAQQSQIVWTAAGGDDGKPGTWGGHAVWVDEFDGALTKGTSWGEMVEIDRSFFAGGYVVGAYALDLAG
jgi:hypothetical protein